MSAPINPANANTVFLIPLSFDNGVFHVLIENWSGLVSSTPSESLGCSLSTSDVVHDAASAFSYLRSFLSTGVPKAEVIEADASVLVSENKRVFLILLPQAWANSIKSNSTGSDAGPTRPRRLWIPLLDTLAMATNLSAMAVPYRPQHPEDNHNRPHFFQSDPPMSRYLSQIPITTSTARADSTTPNTCPSLENPTQTMGDGKGSASDSMRESHHEKQHAQGQVLHPYFQEIIRDSNTLSLIHDLLVRFHPPSRTIRNPADVKQVDLTILDAPVIKHAADEWVWRGQVWDRLVQHRSQQSHPGSHEAIRDINHLENQYTREAEEAAGVNRIVTGVAYLRHMNGFCEILPGLFLTNIAASNDMKKLQENGVTHILRVVPTRINYPSHFVHAVIPIEDVEESDLLRVFEAAKLFIDAGRRSGGCLVHCMAGVSRSTTIILSYVMTELFKDDAHSYLKSFHHTFNKRSVICPNDGFLVQLVTYEGLIKTQRYEQTPIYQFLRKIREPKTATKEN